MQIGIIGSGNIGATAARQFVRVGHEVAISNSRGSDSLKEPVIDLGANAQELSVADAARFGDLVMGAIPLRYRAPE